MNAHTILTTNRIDVERKPIDLGQFVKRQAAEEDCSVTIDKPAAVYENGELKILYLWLDDPADRLVKSLHAVKFRQANRSTGTAANSRVIGYMPRRTIRAD